MYISKKNMNKKLIKTIASVTCGLGIAGSIPFITTSCGSKSSIDVKPLPYEAFQYSNVKDNTIIGFKKDFWNDPDNYRDCNAIQIPANIVAIDDSFTIASEKSYIPSFITIIDLSLCKDLSSINYGFINYCTSIQHILISKSNKTFGLATNVGNADVIVKKDQKGDSLLSETNLCVGCLACGDLIIPQTITTIDRYSFAKCGSLKSVTISKNVTLIEKGAFIYCYLQNIFVDPQNQTYGIANNLGDKATVVVQKHDNQAVWSLNNPCVGSLATGDLVFDENTASINDEQFKGTRITSVYIPNKLNIIGTLAFADDYYIKDITVDENNPMYNYANNTGLFTDGKIIVQKTDGEFKWTSTTKPVGCLACGQINIPSDVTTIASEQLNHTAISTVVFENTLTQIGESAMNKCWNLNKIIWNQVTNLILNKIIIQSDAFTYIANKGLICAQNSSEVTSNQLLSWFQNNGSGKGSFDFYNWESSTSK